MVTAMVTATSKLKRQLEMLARIRGGTLWELACMAGYKPELSTIHIFRAADVKGASAAQSATIAIPASCSLLWLTLFAVAGGGGEDTTVSVRQLRNTK